MNASSLYPDSHAVLYNKQAVDGHASCCGPEPPTRRGATTLRAPYPNEAYGCIGPRPAFPSMDFSKPTGDEARRDASGAWAKFVWVFAHLVSMKAALIRERRANRSHWPRPDAFRLKLDRHQTQTAFDENHRERRKVPLATVGWSAAEAFAGFALFAGNERANFEKC